MLANLPSPSDLQRLTDHRDDASVTIYLPASPLPKETDVARIALKSATAEVARTLDARGVPIAQCRKVIGQLEALESDDEFWSRQARGLAVFAAPGMLEAYRLLTETRRQVTTNDRFDIGVLLRAVAFDPGAYVLAITEGGAHLYGVSGDQETARELDLELPGDLHSVLEYTTAEDQAPRGRALGANGEKTEQQRYCRLVQEAVLARIGAASLPLILAASRELAPAYRAVNSYPRLAKQGIDVNPESLTIPQLTQKARAILEELYRDEITAWGERYELQRSKDRATGDLGHVARAATSSAVEELVFDMDAALAGSIDEDGALHLDDEGEGYGVIDEIAARVLRSGGSVRALHAEDVPNGSPVAAILRYPF
jgi:hypothetical protein